MNGKVSGSFVPLSFLPDAWDHSPLVLHQMCTKFLHIPPSTDVCTDSQLNHHEDESGKQCHIDQSALWGTQEHQGKVDGAFACVVRRDDSVEGRV